jgi:hypothetical protein
LPSLGPVKINKGIEDQGDVDESDKHEVELLKA